MFTYLVRRVLLGSVTLLLITMLVYLLIRSMPGSPLDTDPAMMNPEKQVSKADRDRMMKNYGLDKPPIVGYGQWMGNVLLRADLGRSFTHKRPVILLLRERLWPTILLATVSLVLSLVLAVPLGLYSTAQAGKPVERGISIVLYGLYALPSFVTGLLLLILFYVYLQGTIFQLPRGGMVSQEYASFTFLGKVWDLFVHMILPVICYSYGSLAYYSRFVKSNMEEAIRQDYCRTARAKGASSRVVLIRHAFRNTLVPWVTSLGMMLPGLVSGSIILEQLFDWPGMGYLFFEAITARDYPVIMAEALLFSVLTLLGQLLADMGIAMVDPRVSYN